MYKLLLVTGGTGSGKSRLAWSMSLIGYGMVVSHTDKKPRLSDVNGKDYHFTDTKFMTENKEFIEHITFGGYQYGITKYELMSKFEKYGKAVIVVGVEGLRQILTWLLKNPDISKDIDVVQLHLNIPRDVRFNRILKSNLLDISKKGFNVNEADFNQVYHTTATRINRNDDCLDSDMVKLSKDSEFFNSVGMVTKSLKQVKINMLDIYNSLDKLFSKNINEEDYYLDNHNEVLALLFPILGEKTDRIDLTTTNSILSSEIYDCSKPENKCTIIIGIDKTSIEEITPFLEKYTIDYESRIKDLLIDFKNVEYKLICNENVLNTGLKGRPKNTYFIFLSEHSSANNCVNRNNGSYWIRLTDCIVGNWNAKESFGCILHEIYNNFRPVKNNEQP